LIQRFSKWSTADKSAAVLAVFATALFILKKSWLDFISSPTPLLGYLGIIAEGAMASLVAGSVFFLVVNRLFEIRERAIIEPWIHKKAAFIVGQFDSVVQEISKASNVTLGPNPSELDFQNALSKITYGSNAPLMNLAMHHTTWPVYFKHQMDRSRRAIGNLVDRLRFLTADEVKAVSEVEDHHFFYLVDTLAVLPINPNQNLGNNAGSFRSFAESLEPLRKLR